MKDLPELEIMNPCGQLSFVLFQVPQVCLASVDNDLKNKQHNDRICRHCRRLDRVFRFRADTHFAGIEQCILFLDFGLELRTG